MALIQGKQIATGANGIRGVNVDTSEIPTLASGGTFTGDIVINGGAGASLTVPTPVDGTDAVNKDYVDTAAAAATTVPSRQNKVMPAEVTTSDGDLACDTGIAATPVGDGYIEVFVNGLHVDLGDGVKTKSCYFSGDAGTTARAIADVVSGDELYWNGSIAGYQLDAQDKISFDYNISA